MDVIIMDKNHVLVVDSDSRFVETLKAYAMGEQDICVSEWKREACPLTATLGTICPDILLMDTIQTGQDVLSIMRSAASMKRPPVIVLCARFYSTVLIDAALRFNAALLLHKPIAPEALFSALKEVLRTKTQENTEEHAADDRRKITRYLCKMGFSPQYEGTKFLREGLHSALTNHMLLNNLSKGFYAEAAAVCHSTRQRVERCIRKSIMAAYKSETLCALFPKRPTNGTLIRYLFADMLRETNRPIRRQ